MSSSVTIENLIIKSKEFRSELIGSFEKYSRLVIPKSTLLSNSFGIALEHHVSLHLLTSNNLMTTGMAVFRLQYDAVVRLTWITFSASDLDIKNLSSELTVENAQKDKKTSLSTHQMLLALEKSNAHPPLVQHLMEFRKYSWDTLNSFVHTGQQALGFQKIRFPVELKIRVIQQSNNLIHMAAAVFSEQYADISLTAKIFDLANHYEDCFQFRDSDPSKH